MYFTYLFTILAHLHFTSSLYTGLASGEAWWGNIHHLVQLIKLVNKEEYLIIPEIYGLKQNLKFEYNKIQRYLYALRYPHHLLYLKRPESLQRLVYSSISLQNKLKLTLKKENPNQGANSLDVTSQDVFMSMNSLLHIHHLYGQRITSGYEYDTTKGGSLNSLHSIAIGMMALSRKMHYRAVEWTESFYYDQQILDLQPKIYHIAIQEHNRELFKTKNDEYEPSDLYTVYTNLYSKPIKYSNLFIPPNNSGWTWKANYPPKFWDIFDRTSAHSKFTDLCKGKTLQTPETIKHLKCYYEQYRHPYFYVNPVKVEQLSKIPPILQFYEVLGNTTIDYVKAFREVLINAKTLYGGLSQYLSFEAIASTYARRNMQDYVYKNYAQFGKVMEYLIGLKIRDVAGPLLWAEYTYGRMVGVHTDTRAGNLGSFDGLLTLFSKGELLAALMHYIDTPEEGGHTPFLQAGVRAPAIKGSAVLWMNSYRNGTRRHDVHHAGCPVLHGNKIVMITPIWYKGNWRHHKCSINPEE